MSFDKDYERGVDLCFAWLIVKIVIQTQCAMIIDALQNCSLQLGKPKA